MEAIAADPAIVRDVRARTGVQVADAAEARALAHGGDPEARRVYARAGEAIGRAIGSVVNLLGPELVIISGEGLAAYDLFADRIRDAFPASAFGSAARCDIRTHPLPFEEWARGRGGHRHPDLHRFSPPGLNTGRPTARFPPGVHVTGSAPASREGGLL